MTIMIDRNTPKMQELSKISFWGFKKYDLGKGMWIIDEIITPEYAKRISVSRLLSLSLLPRNIRTYSKGGSVLFFFGGDCRRDDRHWSWFYRMSRLLPNAVVLRSLRGTEAFGLSIFDMFEELLYCLQMRNVDISLPEKLVYANYIVSAKHNLKKIKKAIKENNVKTVITFDDSKFLEYMLTGYCKAHGITTITAEHGFFYPSEGVSQEANEDFALSISDYFMSYGKYEKAVIQKTGMYKGTIETLGMPQFIGKAGSRNERKQTRRFLVALSTNHDQSKDMLELCSSVSERMGYYFEVRPHPIDYSNYVEYAELMGKNGTLVKTDITDTPDLEQMYQKYDFCLFDRSTMILECLYYGINCAIYRKCKVDDCIVPVITCERELETVIRNCMGSGDIAEKDIEDVCGPMDVDRTYAEFFSRFSGGNGS